MKLLICKDLINNSLLETRTLSETENIKYSIVEIKNPEQKEGYYVEYYLDEKGNIQYRHVEHPLSEIELLRRENAQINERLCQVQEMLAEYMRNELKENAD